jgi:hypothetical protein
MAMQSPYIPEISNHQKTKTFNQKIEKTFLDKKHAEEIRKLKETNSTPCEILGYHFKAINLNFSKYQIYEILDGIRQGHNLEPWKVEDAFVKITKYTYWNNFTNALKKLNGNVPKENVSNVDASGSEGVQIETIGSTPGVLTLTSGRGVGIPIEIRQNKIINYQRPMEIRTAEEGFASIDIDSTGYFDYQKILSQYEISEPRDIDIESNEISSAFPDKSICTVIRIAGDFIWLDFPDFEGDPTLHHIAYIPEKKQLLIY